MAFPAAPMRPGTKSKGELVFQSLEGATMVTTMMAKYPLRFILPSKAGDSRVDCAWVFMLYYGGGLVGGDDVEMTYRVGRGCTALLTTQGSTKVYKMPAGLGKEVCTLQVLHAEVERDATLALLPDPTTCFREARFCQRQELDVQDGGSLVFVDWYTCGRMGRGESWAFERFESHTRVRYDGQLMLWEPLVLVSGDDGGGKECASLAERMRGYECFCVVVVLGPRMEGVRSHIRGSEGRPAFTSAHGKLCKPPEANLRSCGSLTSVCELGTQGVVFKAASQTTEDMYGLLRHVLEPLTHVIGVAPYTFNAFVH